jgi:hypothetical protein
MEYVESVWELDADALSHPESALKLVRELWERGEDAKCVAFDIADGLYWHCADWHGGQGSPRYRIMCELDYSPGACERSPEEDEEEREAAFYVYSLLEQGVAGV